MAGRGACGCEGDGLLAATRRPRARSPAGQLFGGLLAQVVRAARRVARLIGIVELLRHCGGLRPFARTLVDGQQRQPRLVLVARAFELLQCGLGAVEQAGAQEVLRQRVLGAIAVVAAQVAAAEQMLVHPHGALVLATPPEEVAQREVQLLRVGIVLHRLDEGIDGLVLLLVQQEVEAAKVGLGCLPVLEPQLAQVEAARPASRARRRSANPAGAN